MIRYLTISLCVCAYSLLSIPSVAQESTGNQAQLVVHVDQGEQQISRHIYGHFAEHLGRCIYDGIWVGKDSDIPNTDGVRNDVFEALKELKIPNLRWPGGCFADSYHWRDGIGPPDKRPERINTWWGGVIETNAFGTHEFLNLCERLGCEPVIAGNVGSGTPQELAEWVEYVNADKGALADERRANGRDKPWGVRYWGIGNESWGCGGNMQPSYYGDLMLRFTTYVRPYGGTRPFHIASGASDSNYRWTEVLMRAYRRKRIFQGLSLHYYTLPTGNWGRKGSATRFEEDQWMSTLRRANHMDELVRRHSEIMDRVDPDARVALVVDEWGTWYDPNRSENPSALYQQNTLRDALVVGINLNIFNNHCRRVRMANIAQTVNVLQAMVLSRGAEMVLTPSYYAFLMFRPHQDATMLPIELTSPDYKLDDESVPAVTASASRNEEGVIHLSFTNANPHEPIEVACKLDGVDLAGTDGWKIGGELLTADRINAMNDFGQQPAVHPTEYQGAHLSDDGLKLVLPAKSVVVVRVENVAVRAEEAQ